MSNGRTEGRSAKIYKTQPGPTHRRPHVYDDDVDTAVGPALIGLLSPSALKLHGHFGRQ